MEAHHVATVARIGSHSPLQVDTVILAQAAQVGAAQGFCCQVDVERGGIKAHDRQARPVDGNAAANVGTFKCRGAFHSKDSALAFATIPELHFCERQQWRETSHNSAGNMAVAELP